MKLKKNHYFGAQRLIFCLFTGFPDLLDSRGVTTITSLLNTSKSPELVKIVLKWARVCCVNHEFNRQVSFILNNKYLEIKDFLDNFEKLKSVRIENCYTCLAVWRVRM